ncbi:MAG: TetR/AcrR family transcriptional regulator [Frankiales bacterium]|nr:TetR/AcrR family transcriptional regulator [Frankiales bacterium]
MVASVSCMSNDLSTSDRIVDASLRVLARRGLRKLSMTDIGDEANVSRGTLYRYFASRDDVLVALEERMLQTLEAELEQAVEALPDDSDRVPAVLGALQSHRQRFPALDDLVESQPRLVLDFFTREFDALLELLTTYLHPALTRTSAVHTGAMSERQLAEVLLRLALTADVISAPGSEWLGGGAVGLWTSLLAPRDIGRTRATAPRDSLRRAS